jgi:hypothetical protein
MNNSTVSLLVLLIIVCFCAYILTLLTIINLNSNPYILRFEMDNNSAEIFKLYFENKTIGDSKK